MPFTPAHPALFYPLRKSKWGINWTALLLGAVIPDFEYFIWLSPSSYVSHTLEGIILFNLPMTVVMAMLWQQFFRPVLLPLLPFFRESVKWEVCTDISEWLLKNPLSFLGSALAGICSHLLWDSFTHAAGLMAIESGVLISHVSFFGFTTRWCYLLWYLSSIAGMGLMLQWYIDPSKLTSGKAWKKFFSGYSFWGKVSFFTLLIMTGRIALGLSWNWARHLVIIGIGSFFYALLITSVIERYRKGTSIFRKEKAGSR